MKPKIIDVQTMRIMSECRATFGNCERSFISPAMYRSASEKIFMMSVSVLRVYSHLCKASTDDVHLPRLPSWVNLYRFCIVSVTVPHHRKRLVDTCTRCYKISMFDKVLLINFVIKCDIWMVVLSQSC